MKIAIGADHAGFPVKDLVVKHVEAAGHSVIDVGTYNTEPVDYPDFAQAVGRLVQQGQVERGILLCGSGVGVCVAANKLHGIRAGLCHDTYSAHQSVEHDAVNVLCMGPRVIGTGLMLEIVTSFLNACFSGETRHQRRVDKVGALEQGEH
jgi:RpiB/LacA/LacB family sugar-phosphate isomerase